MAAVDHLLATAERFREKAQLLERLSDAAYVADNFAKAASLANRALIYFRAEQRARRAAVP
jgi:hypothetical protein